MINLTSPEIQVPTFETCKKLKELGVLPLKEGKSHAYLKHSTNGNWYLSEERWSIQLMNKIQPEVEIIFAPDLGQLLAIAMQFFDESFWAKTLSEFILAYGKIETEKFALELINVIESCK